MLAAMGCVTLIVLASGEPPPPRRVVLATGDRQGAYFAYGVELAELIRKQRGPEVAVDSSGGSVDNLRRLLRQEADVGFVQSGIVTALEPSTDFAPLRAIARVYSEPLWIFHRRDQPLERLSDLKRFPVRPKIAIGAEGSGTRPIARDLLGINGIGAESVELLALETPDAVARFRRGELDVLFLVSSPAADVVQDLLRDPETRVMTFARHRAYSKRLSYLAAVELDQGVISLAHNLPRENLILLAPTATLVTRENVHPRVIERFMKAATHVFGPGNLIDAAGDFPSGASLELPQHVAARGFMLDGESWVSRNLPFWAVRLFSRTKLLLIPLIALLLPLFRFLPALFQLRLRRLLKLHYESLRDAEARILAAQTPADLELELAALATLRDELSKLSRRVPGTYQDTVYQWRVHVNLVREEAAERLAAMRDRRAENRPHA
jgi:uncharacterized protein